MAWNASESGRQLAVSAPHGVEHAHRDRLAAILRRFLEPSIWAFELDTRLDAYGRSQDQVVRFVAVTLWSRFDDRVDHFVALSKSAMDNVHRLLWLLQSEGDIPSAVSYHHAIIQVIAGCGLMSYGRIVAQAFWGEHRAGNAIPLGIFSIGLAWFRRRTKMKLISSHREILYPFGSFSALASTYRTVAFKKDALSAATCHVSDPVCGLEFRLDTTAL